MTIGLAMWAAVSVVHTAATAEADTWSRLFTGLDALRWLIAGLLAALVVVIGCLYWLRPRRRTVARLALGLLAIGVAMRIAVRFEGTYGNLLPRVVWRWSPSAERQWAAYAADRRLSDQTRFTAEEAVVLSETERDFPAFLGPERDGVIRHVRLGRDWRDRPPQLLWRHPIGLGLGGFAIVGDFAVTQEQRGPMEAVVCYELATGRERWAHSDPIRFSASHGEGPRATPTIAGGRVYSMGATGLLSCLDGATGQVLWQQETLADPAAQNLTWGMAGSPLVVDGMVVVSPGGAPSRALVAYRAEDGQPIWSGGDDPAAYASPLLAELGGRRQILCFNGAGLRGHDAADGAPLWLFPWVTQGSSRVNIAQPLVVAPFGPPADSEGFVLVSSGYGVGAALLRIVAQDARWRIEPVWRNRELESKMSNFVVRRHFVYGLDNGVLVCLDLRDGHRCWKRGRYGHGQLLLVDDLLLVQTESGDAALVEATPEEHRELARVELLGDRTWNPPALAGRILVVRNDREAAAFEIAGQVE